MQADTDKLLRRRLYLQRYVTQLFNEIEDANKASDRALIQTLTDFVLDADERDLLALSRQRTRNESARAVLRAMSDYVKEQEQNAAAVVAAAMPLLVDREIAVTASAIGAEAVSSQGVASWPVAGVAAAALIASAYSRYRQRLIAEVSQAAAINPQGIAAMIRGTRAQQYRDGMFYWRNERNLRPNIDVIVNGTAANAATHTYQRSGIKLVDHVSVLDVRVCPRCASASLNGPYEVGRQPTIPLHPRCRCVNFPHNAENPEPSEERQDSIIDFFNRMTNEQREDYMGISRSKLWIAGKIEDVRGLVNERTLQPLRLDQLPEI